MSETVKLTKRIRHKDGGRRFAIAVLLGPFELLLLAVFIIPVIMTIYMSLFSTTYSGIGFGTGKTSFVGLGNLISVLTDKPFISGIGVTVLYGVMFVPLSIIGGLIAALLLDSGLAWGRQITQTILFLPQSVPGIISAMIWLYLYTPGLSPVIGWLSRDGHQLNLLGSGYLIPSIVNIALWSAVGYNMVIFYSALQAIPKEIIEAAESDGAGRLRTALLVKTPMIRGSIVTIGMFAVIGALQLFTEPMLISQSSPEVTSRFTPNMYIFDAAFNRNNYGLAASASLIVLVLCCALSYAVVRFSNRRSAI